MNGFEINKIIASILLTVLIVFSITKITDILFTVDKPSQSVYIVEKAETLVANAPAVSGEDIKTLLAMGDTAHGEKVFKKCSACHMIASGGKNMIGPNLWGVIGAKTGRISDYKYSAALAAYGKSWTFEEMNGFLIKPTAHIKGTKMAFAGLKKEKDRASVILYMNSKSDKPLDLP